MNMNKIVFTALLCLVASMTYAQADKMLGDWKTIDDKTGEARAIVTLYQAADGLYYGAISHMLMYADAVCIACTGELKDAKVEGLVIIRGFHEENGQLVGGKVLDPESGKFYHGKIYRKGNDLVLRGSIDRAGLLGRSQTWKR